ncbi:MAG: nucleotide sugar dehydrogenase [Thermoplasmata archaeon]
MNLPGGMEKIYSIVIYKLKKEISNMLVNSMLTELKERIDDKEAVVCVVGLGYVGWPLAKHFSKNLKTIGFDIDQSKVDKLDHDNTDSNLILSSNESKINEADIVIVCVPTPVRQNKEPDLSFVLGASETVGENMRKGSIVVYESTVYPGATEEECVPILEEHSGMRCGEDFYIGYSPERVNPGDEEHDIDKITKIVSGMDLETGKVLERLYSYVTDVYLAPDIKTAEAAKVIENIQRDLNIALMNELSIIFNKMGLDTDEVLDAAATKWNFIHYHPGLVGGHCIPVDPYYLVKKAKELDYHPQVILAGRSINDNMPKHVAEMTIKGLNEAGKVIKDSKVVIMGLTYKENVEDTRKTPARDLIKELKGYGIDVYGHDPYLSIEQMESFDVKQVKDLDGVDFDVDSFVFTVSHDEFEDITLEKLKDLSADNPLLVDVRRMFSKERSESEGFLYRTL